MVYQYIKLSIQHKIKFNFKLVELDEPCKALVKDRQSAHVGLTLLIAAPINLWFDKTILDLLKLGSELVVDALHCKSFLLEPSRCS